MVEVLYILLGISIILLFGVFSEFLFKKIHIPDIFFLILLGFLIGPYALNWLNPAEIADYAPVFTTFALVFLLYDGAFNISLTSLAKGAVKSIKITLFNFFISVIIISGILILFDFSLLQSILTGFILGGISSAFVIPLLKQINVKGETYSILTLESAMTDVLCIVSAFTVMEIITANTFNFQIMISKIASLFAVAGFVGTIAGIIWIFLVINVFKEHKSYMMTIAYLILVYAITEFLQGNGAIAALFFGLVLRNSKQLTTIFGKIVQKHQISLNGGPEKKDLSNNFGVSVTSETEQFFYSQISFFLKTFFFVYIGLLLNLADVQALVIGGIISIALMSARTLSGFITKEIDDQGRKLIASIFARGLAAAAIAQVVIINKIDGATEIVHIVYTVIIFTIILSSIRIFFIKKIAGIEPASEPSKSKDV